MLTRHPLVLSLVVLTIAASAACGGSDDSSTPAAPSSGGGNTAFGVDISAYRIIESDGSAEFGCEAGEWGVFEGDATEQITCGATEHIAEALAAERASDEELPVELLDARDVLMDARDVVQRVVASGEEITPDSLQAESEATGTESIRFAVENSPVPGPERPTFFPLVTLAEADGEYTLSTFPPADGSNRYVDTPGVGGDGAMWITWDEADPVGEGRCDNGVRQRDEWCELSAEDVDGDTANQDFIWTPTAP